MRPVFRWASRNKGQCFEVGMMDVVGGDCDNITISTREKVGGGYGGGQCKGTRDATTN